MMLGNICQNKKKLDLQNSMTFEKLSFHSDPVLWTEVKS